MKMKRYNPLKLLIVLALLVQLVSFSYAFSGNSSAYNVSFDIGGVGGSSNVSSSFFVGESNNSNYFVRFGFDNYNASNLLENPTMNVSYPLNNSELNSTNKGIQLFAIFSKELASLTYYDLNKTVNLTNYLLGTMINVSIPIDYGQNILEFNFTDKIGNSNSYLLVFNVSLQLTGTLGDLDGDGVNDSEDNIVGDISNVFTSVSNLSLQVNDSTNLSQFFNETLNVSFYDDNKLIVEFQNNFSNNTINLTSVLVKNDTSENKSKLLVSGLSLATGVKKTVYLDFINNSAYKSLCIKDAEIEDFGEISFGCNGTNETYVSAIPYAAGSYNVTYTNSTNLSVKIEGLTHSGVSQTCTESWSYGSWSSCSGGTQTRTATDANSCDTINLRAAISQSCTTSSGGGGGGSSSSSSSSSLSSFVTIPTSTDDLLDIGSILLGESSIFDDDFEVVVDGEDALNSSFNETKTVKIRGKNTQRELVEFDFDFSLNTLDLGSIDMDFGSINGKSYAIIKGLNLYGQTKSVRLVVLYNSNTVCVKDQEVNFIEEVSGNCQGSNEFMLTCDGSVNGDYKCSIEDGYYVVSGLSHSAIIEVGSQNSGEVVPVTTITQPGGDETQDIGDVEDVNIEKSKSLIDKIKDNIMLIYLGLGVILILVILIVIKKLVKKRKNSPKSKKKSKTKNNKTKKADSNKKKVVGEKQDNSDGGEEESFEELASSSEELQVEDDESYQEALMYVQVFRDENNADELLTKLREDGYSEEILKKVFKKEFDKDI